MGMNQVRCADEFDTLVLERFAVSVNIVDAKIQNRFGRRTRAFAQKQTDTVAIEETHVAEGVKRLQS